MLNQEGFNEKRREKLLQLNSPIVDNISRILKWQRWLARTILKYSKAIFTWRCRGRKRSNRIRFETKRFHRRVSRIFRPTTQARNETRASSASSSTPEPGNDPMAPRVRISTRHELPNDASHELLLFSTMRCLETRRDERRQRKIENCTF